MKAEFTGNFRDDYSTNLIKAIIDTQPAADVAEVRHGKWIVDEYKYYRCSECGYEYDGKEDVHIDHIIPLKMADTEEQIIKLCHYTNLQLLKAKDNLKKSAKCK